MISPPAGALPSGPQTRQIPLVLDATFSRLRQLHDDRHILPGNLDRIYIKPGWLAITGTKEECGVVPFQGGRKIIGDDNSPEGRYSASLIGMPLMTFSGIRDPAANPFRCSLKLAVLSALSQPFLGCPGIRSQGWHAECWRAGDAFVQEYPVLGQVIRPDDRVAVAGYSPGIGRIREFCRELHIIDSRTKERFGMLSIGRDWVYGPRNIRVHDPCEMAEVLGNADVIMISSLALADGSFDEIMEHTKNARLTGLFGPGASIVPDAFFSRGIDFIQSCRIVDSLKFVDAIANDADVEAALMRTQKQYLFVKGHNGTDKIGLPRPARGQVW
jgi:hypothetical protein